LSDLLASLPISPSSGKNLTPFSTKRVAEILKSQMDRTNSKVSESNVGFMVVLIAGFYDPVLTFTIFLEGCHALRTVLRTSQSKRHYDNFA
jgi:hypothetical protein